MSLNEHNPITYPTVWQPANIYEARTVAEKLHAGYVWASGTTLLRTQWEMGTALMPDHLISLDRIQEIRNISEDPEKLSIGAMCKLRTCSEHPQIQDSFRLIQDAAEVIAAPSIRNLATIGGNVASGVGDTIPALLVYDASLLWITENGLEEKSLESWLEEWRTGQRNASDLLLNIYIPKETKKNTNGQKYQPVSFFHKIGRREAFTPSLVTVAVHGLMNEAGEWDSIAIAAGGGSGHAMRLRESEALLRGHKMNASSLSKLAETIEAEFMTFTDLYASESYRKQSASNLIVSGLWKSLK
ncbi:MULTISPECIES: FAD binding domain-containing protein [unclassified Paenibacillus]|uniref:FAD binding domain-containing protein n=1 Tax=Paenibacillus provencensis TaxID=441151 RepID=A0ABW3PU20_9BACL|nr:MULTISPECIES: FAD binding domain-containing protein [unclassified Paenibacillus]MCM3126789.1 FAD binding domain-containing protein [Paenibacillus sp. MER 78]SFS57866.1 carbon-monoxide dehydrogenase medium subunit [Paenibacillus sp. 453mf]